MVTKQASRFAVLASSDEDDDFVVFTRGRNKVNSAAGSKNSGATKKAKGKEPVTIPYLVDNVAKKPKKKNVKPSPNQENLNHRDANEDAKSDIVDEDVVKAMQESRKLFEAEQAMKDQEVKDIERVISESNKISNIKLDLERSKSADVEIIESGASKNYADSLKFEDLEAQLNLKVAETDKLKATVAKYKGRMKMYVGLLSDSEYKEKTEILYENMQLKQVNEELLEQVNQMTTELEQLRSKCHESEKALKKAQPSAK